MWKRSKDFKVDLHCHLDGSLPLSTITKLIRLNGLEDMYKSKEEILSLITAPKDCSSLEEYLRCFELPKKLLQTPEAMRIAGFDLAKKLRKSGIRYAEIRFAPQLHSLDIPASKKYSHEEQIIEAMLDGIRHALRFSGTKINVLLCMMRNLPDGEEGAIANSRTISLAKSFLGRGVVGVDLAGAEARDETAEFEEQFSLAEELNIPFTIHAGEAGDDRWRMDSIERAIAFGAKRIGHGVILSKSKELREIVRELGIVVECCPISNLQTKAVTGGIENHPIKMLLDEGIKVTVNTDNMTVSDTSIDKEYELLRTIGITDRDIKIMQRNAIEGAFISQEEKEKLLLELK